MTKAAMKPGQLEIDGTYVRIKEGKEGSGLEEVTYGFMVRRQNVRRSPVNIKTLAWPENQYIDPPLHGESPWVALFMNYFPHRVWVAVRTWLYMRVVTTGCRKEEPYVVGH